MKKRRLLSLVLAICMALMLVPTTALAEGSSLTIYAQPTGENAMGLLTVQSVTDGFEGIGLFLNRATDTTDGGVKDES